MIRDRINISYSSAFSLSEILIVMLIIAVISIFLIKFTISKFSFIPKVQSYAAVKNLNDAANYLKKQGYIDDTKNLVFKFPVEKAKFCKYLADVYNINGKVDCALAD